MQRLAEAGKMRSWVAAPDRGIDNPSVRYEHVKLH